MTAESPVPVVERAKVEGVQHLTPESGERPKSKAIGPAVSRAITGSVVPDRFAPTKGGPLKPEQRDAIAALTPDKLAYDAAKNVSLKSRDADSGSYADWAAGVTWLTYQAQIHAAETGNTQGVDALRAVGLLDAKDSDKGPVVVSPEKLKSFYDRYLNDKAEIEQFVTDIANGAKDIDEVQARVEAVSDLLLSFGKTDSVDVLVQHIAIGRKALEGDREALVASIEEQLQQPVEREEEQQYLLALAREHKNLTEPDNPPTDPPKSDDDDTGRKADDLDHNADPTHPKVDDPTHPTDDHTDNDRRDGDDDLKYDSERSHAVKDLWGKVHRKEPILQNDVVAALGLVNFESAEDGSAIAYVFDRDNGKVIRYYSGKPMPADEQVRKAFIEQLQRELFDNPDVRDGIHDSRHPDVDIIRRKKHLWIKSSESKFFTRARTFYTGTADGVDIAVYYQYSFPKDRQQAEREDAKDKPIAVLMPGWSMGGMSPTATDLAKYVADQMGQPALALDSIAWKHKWDKKSLYREAQVIADLLQAEGLKKVSLVGHSQGGRKALEVALVLQQRREIAQREFESAQTDELRSVAAAKLAAIPEVADIRPINIRGLAHQSIPKLARRFIFDSLVKTTIQAGREGIRYAFTGKSKKAEDPEGWADRKAMSGRSLKAAGSIGGGVYDKWWMLRNKHSRIPVISSIIPPGISAIPATVIRTIQEVREMGSVDAKFKERMQKLKDVPIIFTFGKNDKVSDIAAVIPEYDKRALEERSQYMSQHMHDKYFPGVPADMITVKISETLGGLHGGPPVFAHREVLEPPIEESGASPEDLAAVAAELFPEPQPTAAETVAVQ